MSTTTAVTVASGSPGHVAIYNEDFSQRQKELLKRTVAAGTSDDEFALFCEVARSSGLNPFQRQIYAVMRKSRKKVGRDWVEEDKMVIQTGIDGYRVIAARTGQHAGTSDAEYGQENAQGQPEWAKVTVRRLVGSMVAEFPATARWREYCQTKDEYVNNEKTGNTVPSGQWGKMPYLMLAKCAEALALRKAFPAELAGVYTDDEMAQADNAAPVTVQARREAPADTNPSTGEVSGRRAEAHREAPAASAKKGYPSEAQIKRAYAIGKGQGFDSKEVDKLAAKYLKVASPAYIASKSDYDAFTGDEGILVQAGQRKAAGTVPPAPEPSDEPDEEELDGTWEDPGAPPPLPGLAGGSSAGDYGDD